MVVEGLKIKPYLLGNVSCASRYYLSHNFKLVHGNLDKIMFDQQMNVGKISIENVFGILKNRQRILHCISACVYQSPEIVVPCCVLHNYDQLMGLPPPPKGPQEEPLCHARGQMPFLCEGQVTSQCGETMHATFFTNWMIICANPI